MSRLALRSVLTAGAATLALAATASSASAVVIGFEDRAEGPFTTLVYPTATFSSPGSSLFVVASYPAFSQSPPNYLCTATCSEDLAVKFTNPVSNLSFYGIGIGSTTTAAVVDVFDAKNGRLGTVNIRGRGTGTVPLLVDLSRFVAVSRIRIHNVTDPSGISWDTFRFSVDGVAPKAVAPEREPKHASGD